MPRKSLRPRVLTAVGVGVAVLVLVAFLALRGGDAAEADRVALVDVASTPSATPSGPTPAEVLAESQPGGEWKLVIFDRTVVQRDGTTRRYRARRFCTSVLLRLPAPRRGFSDPVCPAVISAEGRANVLVKHVLRAAFIVRLTWAGLLLNWRACSILHKLSAR